MDPKDEGGVSMKLGKRLIVAAATALAVMAGVGAQPAQALEVNASWQNTGGRWWYLWTVRYSGGELYETDRFRESLRDQNISYSSTFKPQGDSFTDYIFPRSTWAQIDGKWYHFDTDGWMQTGWAQIYSESAKETYWYYLEPSGAMAANKWVKSGGKWYYLAANGHMLENAWVGDYFLGYDGAIADDAWVDGYYVDASGKWRRDVRGFRSGTYIVGRDIPAGEYKLVADNGGTSNTTGWWNNGRFRVGPSEYVIGTVMDDSFERGSWTRDGRGIHPLLHELEDGQVIKAECATIVPVADYAKAVTLKSHLESGNTYKVGLEIPAGTYQLVSTSEYTPIYSHNTPSYCHSWGEMTDIPQFDDDTLAKLGYEKDKGLLWKSEYESFLANLTVTVKDGDYLRLEYCTGDLIS